MNLQPLFLSKVSAGFPSPADDFIETQLDLNQHLIRNPSATFFLKVSGNSMVQAGIFNNDLLIVDRSLSPSHQKIVVAAVDGELLVKRFLIDQTNIILKSENTTYKDIEVRSDQDLVIWGVVIATIHRF